MRRRPSARDRAFFNGFILGHCLGRTEAARELQAEFEKEADGLRADAITAINRARRQVGLPPEQDPLERTRALQ